MPETETILLVAGERSGDMHGAALARALRLQRPGLRLIGTGGARMRAAGVEVLHDSVEGAAIGVVDAMANFSHYSLMYRLLLSAVNRERPLLAVLIDLPDFNMRFAERLLEHNVPACYYVSPQVWAWRPGRAAKLARLVGKMIVLFEFERELYEREGLPAVWVGHPMVDWLAESPNGQALREELDLGPDAPIVAILPGSRRKEFTRIFPVLHAAAQRLAREVPGARFLVGCPEDLPLELKRPWEGSLGGRLLFACGRAHELLRQARLALLASGTATLEAAFFGVPMVVVYKVSPMAWWSLRWMIKVRHCAMVNILAGETVVPEFVQSAATAENIAAAALELWPEDRARPMKDRLRQVTQLLGPPGGADRAASEVLSELDRVVTV